MTMNRQHLFIVSLALLFVCVSGSNDLYAFTPARGMLLIADRPLDDPRFRDRVVLLIKHDAQGTAGLIINRPSRLPLASVLPKGSKLARQGMTLSYGGPIEPKTLFALVKVRNNPPTPADEVIDGIYVTGVDVLDKWPGFAEEVVDYRAFVGYAGWAPDQLDAEIERGDWQVTPADEQSIFEGVIPLKKD